ncbi:protein maternal effect lethal 26-like [Cotesia typhae]|uniref:protein maternal effect lethal 26-like n=1 Tax=Cotesia typhae TaxID=2053667 RepID=UPI003D6894DC
MSLQRRKDGKIHTSWHEYKVFNVSSYLFIDPRRRRSTTEFLTFSSGAEIDNDKWFLRLSFDHSLYSETWVAVQFNSVSKKVATRGYYSIYVVDNKKNEIFVGRRPEYLNGHHIHEIIHFLKRNSSEKEQFLVNDTLTIRLQLTLFLDDITPLPADEIIELYPKADLPDNFNELYKTKEVDGDIVVQVKGKTIRVHQDVLNIRCSKLLNVLLVYNQTEKKYSSIAFDMDPKVFEKLLEFIYLDKVTDLDDHIVPLFGEADKYELKALKRMCEKSLSEDFLTVENAQTIYDLAARFNSHELRGYIVMFLKFNVRETKDPKSPDDRGGSLMKFKALTL